MKCTGHLLACLLVATAACSDSATGPETRSATVISSGTFFNFCAGYCYTELVIDSTTVWFVERGQDPEKDPTRMRTLLLTDAEWARIRALADPAALASVAGVHGCPDCADGGGEWVELRTPTDSLRATFDYGRVLDPIADLQAEIRAIRERFR